MHVFYDEDGLLFEITGNEICLAFINYPLSCFTFLSMKIYSYGKGKKVDEQFTLV